MKIAFVINHFPALSETFILSQITGMIDRGHDVKIFAQSILDPIAIEGLEEYNLMDKLRLVRPIPRSKLQRLYLAVPLILKYLFLHPVPLLNSLNPIKYKMKAMNLFCFFEIAHMLGYAPDVYVAHFGPNGVLAAKMKEYGVKAKVIAVFHGYDIRMGEEQGGHIYNLLFCKGDRILYISEYNRKHLLEFGAKQEMLVYHPNGIDMSKFNPSEFSPENVEVIKILSVGRLVWEKGYEYGLSAIKRVVDSVKIKVEYRIIGGGLLEEAIKKQISELNLENNVVLLGAQTQKVVIEEMKSANIYFLCSVAEALPTVLMEAHAMKLPIVTTKVGSVHEVVIDGKSGFIVEPKNVEEMSVSLCKLIRNRRMRQKFGRKGYEHIHSKYDLNILNDKFEKMLMIMSEK